MAKRSAVALLALVAASLTAPQAFAQIDPGLKIAASKPQAVGKGTARIFVARDASGAPVSLGVTLDKNALDGLQPDINNTSRCFGGMCLGDYEMVFAIPPGEAGKAVAPFKWVSVNWNPKGHGMPAPPPWAEPHFDFHFYIAERASILALKPGSCGEMIDCADFKIATKPVPPAFVHADHINVDAAVPTMGNHLINSKAPELQPGGPKFTHTFIFGANDGRVAFYEPMITRAFLASRPDMCAPIKQPAAWAETGQYPTRYCIRYSKRTGGTTVSLEGFVARTARVAGNPAPATTVTRAAPVAHGH